MHVLFLSYLFFSGDQTQWHDRWLIQTSSCPENFYAYFISQLTYNHLSPSIHAIFYSLYIALAIFIMSMIFKKFR